jgi:DNA polymerase III alpha subunit
LTRRFAADVMLLLYPCYNGQDEVNFARIAALAQRYSLPLVASAAPIMHHGARRRLTDTLTAIRLGVRVDALGRSDEAREWFTKAAESDVDGITDAAERLT